MALSETARDALREAGDRHDIVAEVRDETGRLVLTASLSLVVQQVA